MENENKQEQTRKEDNTITKKKDFPYFLFQLLRINLMVLADAEDVPLTQDYISKQSFSAQPNSVCYFPYYYRLDPLIKFPRRNFIKTRKFP